MYNIFGTHPIQFNLLAGNNMNNFHESDDSDHLSSGIIKDFSGGDHIFDRRDNQSTMCNTDLHITQDMEENEKYNTMKLLIDDHPYRLIKYLKYKMISISDVLKYIESYTSVQRNHLIIYGYICEHLYGLNENTTETERSDEKNEKERSDENNDGTERSDEKNEMEQSDEKNENEMEQTVEKNEDTSDKERSDKTVDTMRMMKMNEEPKFMYIYK